MTYKIYELKLKPISSWITDLTADTIFGHLCWQIKYKFSDEVLEKFLEEMEQKPIFTISDVLPADRLPRPLTEYDGNLGDADKEDFETNKKIKKINFIFRKTFKKNYLGKKIIGDNLQENVWDIKREIEDEKNYKGIGESNENKNIVNRLAGTTLDNGIYSQNVNYSTNKYDEFSLFIKIFDENKFKELEIIKLLKNIFEETGFGKKKSIGKGNFKIINFENKEYIKDGKDFQDNYIKLDGENILLLSSFIPSINDSTEGNYKLFTKFPKLGEEFSLEGQNFYKKPLVMIQTGSTFKKTNNNGYIGKMIKDVDFADKGIYHYAYGFTIEF